MVTQRQLKRAGFPPIAFGLTSVILGAMGLLLFVLPVLGVPISISGAVVGLIGIVAALLGGHGSLRLCVAGIMLCSVAAGINYAIELAPSGYFSPSPVFPDVVPTASHGYVSPPAPPNSALHEGNINSPMRSLRTP